MAKTVYPPEVQSLLDRIKNAKKTLAEVKAREQSNTPKYELKITYTVCQAKQELTLPLCSISDLGAWKEAERFLRDLFVDDDYSLIHADITEWSKTKYTSTDYFFIWRQQ